MILTGNGGRLKSVAPITDNDVLLKALAVQLVQAFARQTVCNIATPCIGETIMEDLKKIIAENLVSLRKSASLTQQELAEKLNYSDKAVSKWERGESIPDIVVLKQIADLYGVKVDDFLCEHKEEKLAAAPKKIVASKHLLITLLSVGLVFLIATVVMVVWLLVDPSAKNVDKYCYITALPVAAIVAIVFCALWGKMWMTMSAVSVLVWTSCLLLDVLLPMKSSWLIYLIGAALQLLVVLWFLLRYVTFRGKIHFKGFDK